MTSTFVISANDSFCHSSCASLLQFSNQCLYTPFIQDLTTSTSVTPRRFGERSKAPHKSSIIRTGLKGILCRLD